MSFIGGTNKSLAFIAITILNKTLKESWRFISEFIWNRSYPTFVCELGILKFFDHKFLKYFWALKSAIKMFPILWVGREKCKHVRFVVVKYMQIKNLPFCGLSETLSLFFCFFLFSTICLFSFWFDDLSFLHFFSNTKAALALSAWRVFILFASSSSSSETWKHYLMGGYINKAQNNYYLRSTKRHVPLGLHFYLNDFSHQRLF